MVHAQEELVETSTAEFDKKLKTTPPAENTAADIRVDDPTELSDCDDWEKRFDRLEAREGTETSAWDSTTKHPTELYACGEEREEMMVRDVMAKHPRGSSEIDGGETHLVMVSKRGIQG